MQFKNEADPLPHSSPEVPAMFPILCVYFYEVKLVVRVSVSLQRIIVLIAFRLVRLQLGLRWGKG